MNMGDVVVSLNEYLQRNPDKRKSAEYRRLKELEKELFGETEEAESFLELIAQEAETTTPINEQPRLVTEVSARLGNDLHKKGYLDFGNLNADKYGSFLNQSLLYTYTYEANQAKADKICSVALHLFRYQQGLPSLFKPEEINKYRKTVLGKMSYWLKERKVNRELVNLQLGAMHTALETGAEFHKVQRTTSSSPGYSSGSSSPTAS